jgi:phenylacetate-coenzyme A ligase PaaK-like adenylate-forming protein
MEQHDLSEASYNLPYVYVYERNDFSVSYYAFLIYPETIRRSLLEESLQKLITGKFSMLVEYDKEGRQRLYIHVECAQNVQPNEKLASSITTHIHDCLVQESSEYRETFSMLADVVKPIVKLWDYENIDYFKPGAKQKWVM